MIDQPYGQMNRSLTEDTSSLAQLANRLFKLADELRIYKSKGGFTTQGNANIKMLELAENSFDEALAITRDCLKSGHELAIEAHTHVLLAMRHIEDALDTTYLSSDLIFDREIQRKLQEGFRLAHESSYAQLEFIAAKMLTELETTGHPVLSEPLTARAQPVFEIIRELGPIIGKHIIEK